MANSYLFHPSVVDIECVYHSGTLQEKDKKHNTYEGPCLSVSLDREGCEMWRRIADLPGEDHVLRKRGGTFIDIRKALTNKECMRTMWHWGCEGGYAVSGEVYRVTYFDSELNVWLSTSFLSKKRAMEEAEEYEKSHIQTIQDFLPTHRLANWALWDEIPFACVADLMLLLFIEHWLPSIDGGVWTYPSSHLAAPLAGIFPSKVGDWAVTRI